MRSRPSIHTFDNITSVENLLATWKVFVKGKRKKKDVRLFQHDLLSNIHNLQQDLENRTYRHGPYEAFNISDPKPRNIHKASVRDRLVHRLVYETLYPYFDARFITDSYSCREGKGVHRALERFTTFGYRVSKNHTRTAWVLKCDIRKFFASIDQAVLMRVLKNHVGDPDLLWLIEQIVSSFRPGLPLGNLTSQLLVNVYMNESDQFIKHTLKMKYYIRYADDFVLFSHSKEDLVSTLASIKTFLEDKLKLELHPKKVSIQTVVSGVDFLGWVHFPDHRVLRASTKRRLQRTTKGWSRC